MGAGGRGLAGVLGERDRVLGVEHDIQRGEDQTAFRLPDTGIDDAAAEAPE